ncbi:adhesion G protein-coupled receptor L3 [Lingula anatina]|uniref:Adhesion G protein-coupled receptor L3 n=1 Tax=Lingula anatina TaxID=7574 RepID=A0A1S3INM4_LINAN|nr:adhesion G protein-coupled receptor L3 [Lingula anatina]|eukprot:XP_013399845.1 adhesion G protein-coupled receptor L3 [Lingula anatina]
MPTTTATTRTTTTTTLPTTTTQMSTTSSTTVIAISKRTGRPVYARVPQACLVPSTKNVSWENKITGLYAVTECPEGTVGVGWWECNPVTGMHSDGPDYSDCTHPWVANIVHKFYSDASVSPGPVITNLTVSLEQSAVLEPGDIIAIGDLLPNLINRQITRVENTTETQKEASIQSFARATVTLGSSLLSPKTLPAWNQIKEDREVGVATSLMTSIEHSGFLLADSQTTTLQRMKRDNIVVESRQFYKSLISEDRSLNFSPDVDGQDLGTSISIPSTALESEYNPDGDYLSLVFVLYDTIDQVLPNGSKSQQNTSSLVINSKVASASVVKPGYGFQFDHGQQVTVTFKHYKQGLANTSKCVFLDMSLRSPAWSTRGCRKISENATYTVCACNHLTSFAVLMDIGGTVGKIHRNSDQADGRALSVITLVGCTISIVCLLICVITFTVFRSLRCLRNVIHRNLCLCLLLAETVFLAGVDKTQNQVGCAIVAALLHFFFLAAFAWMCLEGVQLYMLVIEVFESKNCRSLYFYLMGYGLPAFIVAISAAARPSGYGTLQFCWLSTEHLFILSFAIPVSVTVIFNTVILIIAMRVVVSHNKEQSTKNKLRLWLKGSAILVCLLGLTWIFGFLYLTKDLMAFAYIFTILNSFQGLFIFIFHCAMNDNVQSQYKKTLATITCLPCDFQDKYRDSRSLSVNHMPEHYSRQTSTTYASKKHSLV